MNDYKKEYTNFSLPVPERFSFPLDVFDKWGDRLALFWTDGVKEKKISFADLPKTISGKIKRKELKIREFEDYKK
ncbi:MAG: hypothetical protein HY754_09895 [Nitrospirae bacterium]|nr:hypothetical protein [Nitrospirota bacterium]